MSAAITPEFLKTLAFFTPATDAELTRLIPTVRREEYPAGAVLFREGDELSDAFIVIAGTVALEVTGRDRRPRLFQTVGPGELLGWSPLLGIGPMTASARALTDVEVVAIDALAVLTMCEEDPWFGYLFMRRMAAAIAARLSATRLLDVDGPELSESAIGGRQ
jgi:CRP-like cAMP-binding protein